MDKDINNSNMIIQSHPNESSSDNKNNINKPYYKHQF